MTSLKLTFVAMALLLASFAHAQLSTTNTYGETGLNLVIPDNNEVGIARTIPVSGLTQNISYIQVTLDITGGFNGDLYAYLLGPQGGFAVLLNRVGVSSGNSIGYANPGFNNTFVLQDGYSDVHTYQSGNVNLTGPLGGIWAPDGRNIDPQSSPSAFDVLGTANFSVFENTVGNGNWTIFVADLSPGSQSQLIDWGLTIVTVPEPQTWAMVIGGSAMLLVLRRRKR